MSAVRPAPFGMYRASALVKVRSITSQPSGWLSPVQSFGSSRARNASRILATVAAASAAAICLIVLPVFAPIISQYDFSAHLGSQQYLMTWFGTLVAVNLQTAFMSPPFGATLFYMKGTAPPGVTMTDVYRGMYPFVALQVIGLMLCIYFPSIVLWLPKLGGFLD